jgi:hypothetical protein
MHPASLADYYNFSGGRERCRFDDEANLWCGMVYGGMMREEIEMCCEL